MSAVHSETWQGLADLLQSTKVARVQPCGTGDGAEGALLHNGLLDGIAAGQLSQQGGCCAHGARAAQAKAQHLQACTAESTLESICQGDSPSSRLSAKHGSVHPGARHDGGTFTCSAISTPPSSAKALQISSFTTSHLSAEHSAACMAGCAPDTGAVSSSSCCCVLKLFCRQVQTPWYVHLSELRASQDANLSKGCLSAVSVHSNRP